VKAGLYQPRCHALSLACLVVEGAKERERAWDQGWGFYSTIK